MNHSFKLLLYQFKTHLYTSSRHIYIPVQNTFTYQFKTHLYIQVQKTFLYQFKTHFYTSSKHKSSHQKQTAGSQFWTLHRHVNSQAKMVNNKHISVFTFNLYTTDQRYFLVILLDIFKNVCLVKKYIETQLLKSETYLIHRYHTQ